MKAVRPALAGALVLGLMLPASATAGTYSPEFGMGNGTWNLHIVENFASTGEGMSVMKGMKRVVPPSFTPGSLPSGPIFFDMPDEHLCMTIGEAPCDPDSIVGVFLLPTCAMAQSGPCVDSVSANGEKLKYLRAVTTETFQAQSKYGLPTPGSITLWEHSAPLSPSQTKNLGIYAKLAFSIVAGKVTYNGLRVTAAPYTQESSANARTMAASEFTLPTGRRAVQMVANAGKCFWGEAGLCGVYEDFGEDVRLAVSLRVPDDLTGWLSGRLKDPQISVKSAGNDYNMVSVEALPVSVPRFRADIPVTQIPEGLKRRYPAEYGSMGGATMSLVSDQDVFNNFSLAVPFTNDKAAGRNVTWSFSSFEPGRGNSCLAQRDRLVGLVTTNAMIFPQRAPDFENNFLTYKVAGTHFDADGELFKGTYDLVLDSKVARCLYGFTNAPVSASVSVTYGDKETNVATTVVSEKDGWLKLAAYGFTFSSPTLKVAIKQSKTSSSVGSTKKTITCVKGKTTRKITAVSPKCPAGFKRK